MRAPQPAPAQHDRHDDQVREPFDPGDVDIVQTQQTFEYSGDAHGQQAPISIGLALIIHGVDVGYPRKCPCRKGFWRCEAPKAPKGRALAK